MLQEFFDKIAILFGSLFTLEAVRVLQTAVPRNNPLERENSPDNGTESSKSMVGSSEGPVSTQTVQIGTSNQMDEVQSAYVSAEGLNNLESIYTLQDSMEAKENEQENDTIYGTITIPKEQTPTFFSSFKTSFCMSLTMTVAIIPVSLVMIFVLYIDVNTSSVCYQQKINNKSLPREVMTYVIIGDNIESFALNFWFQLTLVLLFSWKIFKCYYSCTLLLGFLLGLTVVIFKTTLFLVDIDFTQAKYRYPGNAIFLFGVIYLGYLVAKTVSKKFSSDERRVKKRKVFLIISTQFFFGFLIAMAYRYVFLPWYRSTNDDILRVIIAMITPTLILIPMVISETLAIKSSLFTKPGRRFALVYFVNGVSILLYCIMQAGMNDFGIFVLLSVLRALLQILQTATIKIRQKIVIAIWKCFEHKFTSCPHLEGLEDSADHCRLKVDKEIQIMLYQSTAIILSQAYLVLYLISNYDVETRQILEEFIMKRVIVGIGISLLANFVSILIHIRLQKTRLIEVWNKQWKRHLLALMLGGIMSICYFTVVLLSVFERFAQSKKYHVINCTDPFA